MKIIIIGLIVVVLFLFTGFGISQSLIDLLETKEIGGIGWGVFSIASLNFAKHLVREMEA